MPHVPRRDEGLVNTWMCALAQDRGCSSHYARSTSTRLTGDTTSATQGDSAGTLCQNEAVAKHAARVEGMVRVGEAAQAVQVARQRERERERAAAHQRLLIMDRLRSLIPAGGIPLSQLMFRLVAPSTTYAPVCSAYLAKAYADCGTARSWD